MYIPHTPEETRRMLDRCSMKGLADLYADVPEQLKMKGDYDLPLGKSEQEVADFFAALGEKNRQLPVCLAGAGFYDHYAPAAVSAIISRSEFSTAYTPYQPEISQGTLQYIFEYQSMMTRLTGLDISNASMYDATTAAAEAMMMMVASGRKRDVVLMSATVNPLVRNVVETYAKYQGVKIEIIPEADGATDFDAMRRMLEGRKDVAGVILAQPNFYGIVEDLTGVADTIHEAKGLLTMICPALTLASLKTPGEWGADIAGGDAQSLGMPLNYGGPYLGYLCCTKALMRKLPGRIVGATTDARGQRVFVLTLQAREQHIRRQKATSNICSNQGLMALYATIFTALNGEKGLTGLNRLGHDGACYLADALAKTGKMRLAFPGKPFLNEFAVDCDIDLDALFNEAIAKGILPGVKIADRRLLIAVTERQSRDDLDRFVEIVKSLPSKS